MRRKYRLMAALLIVYMMTMLNACMETGAGNEPAHSDTGTKEEAAADTSEGEDVIYVQTDAEGDPKEIYKGSDPADLNDTRLPIEVKISYSMDGEEKTPEEITGGSGHVTVRIDYTVLEYETLRIGGELCTVYAPMLVISAAVLNNSNYHDIRVSNGDVMGIGDNTAVAGYAMPGLSESLGIRRSEDIDIPGSVEFSAYTDSFEPLTIYTVASAGMLEGYDDDPDFLTELISDVSSMNKATDSLMNGAENLESGMEKLISGAEKISDASSDIAAVAAETAKGAAELSAGADTLSSGLAELSGKSSSVNEGAKSVFESLLESAEAQLRAQGLETDRLTMINYKEELTEIIDSLDKEKIYSQILVIVTDEVEKNRAQIEKEITAMVRETVKDRVATAVRSQIADTVTESVEASVRVQVIERYRGMSVEDYESAVAAGQISEDVQSRINDAVAQEMTSDSVRGTIENQISARMESDEIQSVIEEQTSGQMASDEVKIQISNAVESQIQNLINEAMSSDEVQKKLAAAEEGAKTVIALKASLDNYNAFYLGVLAYTGAVDQAAAGARDVTSGSEDLAAGAAALSEGCCELSEKLFEFSEGAETIRDGSSDLKDGISRFDKEAVKRMSDFVNKDLSDYSDKLRAVTNIGRKYRNGYPLSNGSDGRYRYVFKSDSF